MICQEEKCPSKYLRITVSTLPAIIEYFFLSKILVQNKTTISFSDECSLYCRYVLLGLLVTKEIMAMSPPPLLNQEGNPVPLELLRGVNLCNACRTIVKACTSLSVISLKQLVFLVQIMKMESNYLTPFIVQT